MTVTDVGSTKAVMLEAGRALTPPAMFIGGHPLAGGERGGFAYARPDLFAGRPWILTPAAVRTDDAGLERLTTFVSGVGALPTVMDASEHDQLMAFLSHLPQLTASALMSVVGAAAGEDGLRWAGRGLVDTTRLASSPANVWRDVCETNAEHIGQALDLLIAKLTELRAGLVRHETVDALFESSARWRTVITKARE